MYSNNKQPWMGVWMATGTSGKDCVASRVGENNDADGTTSKVRSGQRGGQDDRGGGKRCVWGPGPSGRPVGIVQVGGCNSGDVLEGRSRRRDLALGVSQYLVTSEWPG